MYFRTILTILVCLIFGVFPVVEAQWVQNISVSSSSDGNKARIRENMINTILMSPPWKGFTTQVATILIDQNLVEPRGRMKGRNISLSAHVMKDSEFLQLFTHEFAHFIDIYVLKNENWEDRSDRFYRVSWIAPDIKRSWQKMSHFVSGYAATNQYEDFAESFVLYVFHNRVFLDRAMRDDIIREKYLFFQTEIFPSGVFVDTNFSLGMVPSYFWDTTKLPISLQKYLYFLSSSI